MEVSTLQEAPASLAMRGETQMERVARAEREQMLMDNAAMKVASLSAPVTRPASIRNSRTTSGRAPSHSVRSGEWGQTDANQEEKFPLPDNAMMWARYGFIDGSYLSGAEGDAAGMPQPRTGGRPADAARHTVRFRSEPGDGRRGPTAAEHMRSQSARDYPAAGSSSSMMEAAVIAAQNAERASAAPSSHLARIPANANAASTSRPRPRPGPLSPDFGSSTPPTVILTPSSQERCRQTHGAAAGDCGCSSEGAAVTRSLNNQDTVRRLNASARPPPRDSLAASLAASAASTTAAAAAVAAAAAEAEEAERAESKEEELMALRQQEELEAEASSNFAAEERAAAAAAATAAAGVGETLSSGDNSSADSCEKDGSPGRRPSRSMAEVERHKRNRAERLRAYGCQRTLYPRIVPGGTGGGSGSGSGRGSAVTEETETQEWVDTLRVSASLRGECLMATCSQSFVEGKATMQLGEKQSEARASRTADVSEMDGPDGLLHCAALRGDHALAARAAQFLVDKKGASVNSRDDWGRTPLHTASGKGMVAMSRFFIRRGADVDAIDYDDRTPLFFACAGGNTTMARYLTRIEVGARLDLRDVRGHLAGEFFWDTVDADTRDEIMAILIAAGWPHPPPVRQPVSRGRCAPGKKGRRSRSASSLRRPFERGGSRSHRQSEGGEAGMKRLASDMMLLMRRR